jgi:hypothetical protein
VGYPRIKGELLGLGIPPDLGGAIGFSSFAVLAYYGVANVSAWTQPPGQRRWPKACRLPARWAVRPSP